MKTAMTKKELATVAGYTYRRLHDIDMELPKDKKLFVASETDGKKYDLAVFVQRWVAYNRQATETESEELSVVKAQHEKVKKEKTELEVAKLKGEVADVLEIHRIWSNIATILRERFINMPRKLAQSLVMISSAERIEAIIDREVRDALSMVANTPLPGDERTAPAGTINPESEEEDEEA